VLAHEVRPAYLELKQTGPETYDVFWKVPGRGEDLRLGLYVELPAGTTNLSEPRASFVNGAFAERWSIKRAGGLTGGTIHIAGLSATMTDVLVRVESREGTTQVIRLTPSAPSFVVEAVPRALDITRTYLVLGGRAHPAGHRPSPVRARASHPGERLAATCRHHYRFHAGTQHHPGRGHAGVRERSGTTG
jgi:hypothetical protein